MWVHIYTCIWWHLDEIVGMFSFSGQWPAKRGTKNFSVWFEDGLGNLHDWSDIGSGFRKGCCTPMLG